MDNSFAGGKVRPRGMRIVAGDAWLRVRMEHVGVWVGVFRKSTLVFTAVCKCNDVWQQWKQCEARGMKWRSAGPKFRIFSPKKNLRTQATINRLPREITDALHKILYMIFPAPKALVICRRKANPNMICA